MTDYEHKNIADFVVGEKVICVDKEYLALQHQRYTGKIETVVDVKQGGTRLIQLITTDKRANFMYKFRYRRVKL